MDVNVENLQIYSDKTWLIYVLDQIINNAIKYAKESPQLKIWSEHHEEQSIYILRTMEKVFNHKICLEFLKKDLLVKIIIMDNINLLEWDYIWWKKSFLN